MKKNIIIGITSIVAIVVIVALVTLISKSKYAPEASLTALKEAENAFRQGNYLESKDLYKKLLEATDDANKLKEIQKKIEDINIKIIFSPLVDKCSIKYTVKAGDILAKIAKEYNTTVELIKRANNLSSDVIRPEQQLKLVTCKFSIAVDKSQNLLFLKNGDEVVKTYVVSTGKENCTPVGSFKIVNKEINPTWFKTGAVIAPGSPENILGTRWLGLDLNGY